MKQSGTFCLHGSRSLQATPPPFSFADTPIRRPADTFLLPADTFLLPADTFLLAADTFLLPADPFLPTRLS